MSDSQIDHLISEQEYGDISDRPGEGSAGDEGSLVIRALLLILGGIAIVSYAMMTLPGLDG